MRDDEVVAADDEGPGVLHHPVHDVLYQAPPPSGHPWVQTDGHIQLCQNKVYQQTICLRRFKLNFPNHLCKQKSFVTLQID